MATMYCSECGSKFEAEDLVNISGSFVCSSCKPIVLQKVEEYGVVNRSLMSAGFWIRFLAFFIDQALITAAMFFLAIIAGVFIGLFRAPPYIMVIVVIAFYIMIPIYHIFYLGKYGATLGKRIVKIKVVRMDGSSFGYGLATGRFFGFILSYIIFCIGCIMAAFDKEYKRALHDRICNTRVVYV